jgi:lysophospholipase L1-like esterase
LKSFTYPSLVLASLVLVACGGGGSSGDAPSAASSTSTSVADQAGGSSDGAATPAAPSTAASSWTSCGTEGQTCSFSGTRNVRFGANGSYTYKTATAAIRCSVSDFADPLPGAAKSCDYSDSTAAAAAPVSAKQIVEYYGDSTVWGYKSGVGGQVATPAPAAFAAALPAAGNYDVRNEGVSGTTACDLLNGTDGKHAAWSSQMAASKAKYVLVNFAINDEWKYDVNTYKSCLGSLASIAKQNGKQMIFETPNPTRDSGSTGLDVYVNAMKSVATAQSVPVIDQYQYLTNYLNGQSAYTICPDGLHPNDAVYVMKGQYAASVFPSIAN